MGCISSKEEDAPAAVKSPSLRPAEARRSRKEAGSQARVSSSSTASLSAPFGVKIGLSLRHVDAELVSAGWPPWLSAAAGEAIHGWIPLRADSFAKLEKIGQGTYSSVFRAKEVESGRIVALKKVRFDNYQAESVRFMAREITILRRLDHPNIMKLEGLITSGSSNSIYLVFEYMEHDLAGLVSSPDVKFTESQVKCYMRQLLSAVEHCHLRGIIHRDIKVSNILLNNQGVLKLGDFGLANIVTTKNRQSLTSRVVTLWYRPPELLMGSTTYGVSVDLWSIGCVFAELFARRPILKGRTEVEQLHKIFKLCGSPSEDYWSKSRLPHTTMFRPQHPYESSLKERFRDVPSTALELIETFLSVEPCKRGTASSALISQYFRTQPYACDPSSLPKYPPTKEMDAKSRDDSQKRKNGNIRHPVVTRKPRRSRKTLQQQTLMTKFAPKEVVRENNASIEGHTNAAKPPIHHRRNDSFKPTFDTVSENYQTQDDNGGGGTTGGNREFSGPVPVSASSGFAWAAAGTATNGRRKDDTTSVVSNGSRFDPSFANQTYGTKNMTQAQDHDHHRTMMARASSRRETRKPIRGMSLHHHHESADFEYRSPEITHMPSLPKSMDFDNEDNLIEFSGPLLLRPQRIDDLLYNNENHIRQAARKSRFLDK